MMTATELQALKLDAKITLQIADNEGWISQDGTRNLANLAIKAAGEIERLRAQNAGPFTDSQGRAWHVMEREDKSVSIYYTIASSPAHYVVFDSLDAGLDESKATDD